MPESIPTEQSERTERLTQLRRVIETVPQFTFAHEGGLRNIHIARWAAGDEWFHRQGFGWQGVLVGQPTYRRHQDLMGLPALVSFFHLTEAEAELIFVMKGLAQDITREEICANIDRLLRNEPPEPYRTEDRFLSDEDRNALMKFLAPAFSVGEYYDS